MVPIANCLAGFSFRVPSPGISRPSSFSLPRWFQVRAWRVMLVGGFLRVCPSHLRLRFFISSSTSSSPVLCQRSLLLMVSGQIILNIFRRHPLMKVWILLLIFFFVFQVSEPYKSADFTLELKNCSFVLVLIWRDLNTFLNYWIKMDFQTQNKVATIHFAKTSSSKLCLIWLTKHGRIFVEGVIYIVFKCHRL